MTLERNRWAGGGVLVGTLALFSLAAAACSTDFFSGDDAGIDASPEMVDANDLSTDDGAVSLDPTTNGGSDGSSKPDGGLAAGDAANDGASNDGSSMVDAAFLYKVRHVFVTQAAYTPGVDFTGIAGADALCTSLAQAATSPNIPRGATFAAWLSSSTDTPAKRFVHGRGPYLDSLNNQIAASFDDLLMTGPTIKPDYDQTGTRTDGYPWTGTLSDGTTAVVGGELASSVTCSEWTNAPTSHGSVGYSGDTGKWTKDTTHQCDGQGYIYCFEQ